MLRVGNWSEKTFLIFAFLSSEAFNFFVEFFTCLYSIPILQTASCLHCSSANSSHRRHVTSVML